MKKLASFFATWIRLVMVLGGGLLAAAGGHAATVLSGNVSGTWTLSGSPYILSANCTVLSNQTLTIQPGVEVIPGFDVSLSVFGRITLIGSPTQPIWFHGTNPTNYWRGIGMPPGTNRIQYCRFSDGNTPILVGATGGDKTVKVEILNCEFINCSYAGIYGGVEPRLAGQPNPGNATLIVEIENCVFDSTGYGCEPIRKFVCGSELREKKAHEQEEDGKDRTGSF